MAKLMLIDGNSLTYRAFFALPTDMATAHGQVTNAVYGFTSMLINLLRDHQPDHVAVAFDRPEPTFRHKQVEEYKATREAAPDILRQQMGLVREVAEALRIPIIDQIGFEADDIIATLATNAATPAWRRSSSPATATATSSSRTRSSRSSTTGAASPTTRSTTRRASRKRPVCLPTLVRAIRRAAR